ncbi:hypothetical protein AM501_11665 [Aneurinibacillus migulanus]|uniref:DUF3311 domain-containing protein n=1 Tax=Aneurinibacillus migulanus TaxID=47500 RepID=A0A0D1VZU2_ANEMI|nr:DUF3311 domain-containing protein [Aneurinibacillus migulanus]KIV51705.1 hypothetical protein TS65_24205 [Aneurinibacillus migulanus]KIV54592.1 hypothetical protein TS64_16385 [Aneurinibacillus migulanus]KON97821.1 hypothetical protein AF333_22685 [Aneurinibacillus migulanus]KPD08011.1 hypothetical protein AM501_11665 [Aneurinibacillus migulanus]MCP1358513.1 DUF3311 domain-containing protein [Aneurinibacillus migulanus]
MKIVVWLLSIIPAVGSLTVINRIEPYIFGLPFIVFWATMWLILSSVCLYICSIIQDKEEANE